MKRRKRDSTTSPIHAEVTSILREMCRSSRSVHPEIWAHWAQITGPEIGARAFPHSLKAKILTVGVVNSTWLHELSFLKNDLLDRIIDKVGPGVVVEVRFVLDTRRSE